MYAALWRILPGPTWAKIIECVVLALAVTFALLFWVFPWVEPMLAFDRIIVEEA